MIGKETEDSGWGSRSGAAEHRSRRQAWGCSGTHKVLHGAATRAQVWTVIAQKPDHWEFDPVKTRTMGGKVGGSTGIP